MSFQSGTLPSQHGEETKTVSGCRGYEELYPDHKRVMMEIMGTTKKENPIRKGWLQKVRPNTYRLTDLGKTEVDRLTNRGDDGWCDPTFPPSNLRRDFSLFQK